MTFLTILGVTEISCSFRLVLEGKAGKEIPESSTLVFLAKFSANNFPLSDAEDNTSGLWNRGDIADIIVCLLVAYSKFGLLTIRWHSATRKHLFPYPQGDRSSLTKEKKNKHQH